MRVCRSFMRKIPSEAEYSAFDGGRFRKTWFSLSPEWRCPVCGRSKKELMRWGRRKGINGVLYGFEGWRCSFHVHHDHGDRWKERVLICGDCNAADGMAKRLLKLPSEWSFSADELREFVKCEPNGTIESIDLDIAMDIFLECCAMV